MGQKEEFNEQQKKLLSHFVTNTTENVFALRNLPEVIKGCLFSKYSRSMRGLRWVLLKEFIQNQETNFEEVSGGIDEKQAQNQEQAVTKAQNFYDRILDGYGDDSIGELGGAHLAMENVSMLAAKIIEDCRIGGSPLEKSTRYIYFDQKVNDEYLFYKEPILMTSAHRNLYIETCNQLFDTYSSLIPPLTKQFQKSNPKQENVSDAAYRAALRAKVLDCLRGLLPASTYTNLGLYGNGRFFEGLLQKLHSHNLSEPQALGALAYKELNKIIPSFVRRADINHRHFKTYSNYMNALTNNRKRKSEAIEGSVHPLKEPSVKMVSFDEKCLKKVATALLFEYSKLSLEDLSHHVDALSSEELDSILAMGFSNRDNRRHKAPRAFEHASFTFEIVADFGIYRDLHRHRTLTQERQILSCDLGYFTPKEIIKTEMEAPYHKALEQAKKAFDVISFDLPEEAQYIVPMAYNIRWYFQINLRALQWLCELRSSAAGHSGYRYVAQEMASQVISKFPGLKGLFSFVDFDGYDLGRLDQEIHSQAKKEKVNT